MILFLQCRAGFYKLQGTIGIGAAYQPQVKYTRMMSYCLLFPDRL